MSDESAYNGFKNSLEALSASEFAKLLDYKNLLSNFFIQLDCFFKNNQGEPDKLEKMKQKIIYICDFLGQFLLTPIPIILLKSVSSINNDDEKLFQFLENLSSTMIANIKSSFKDKDPNFNIEAYVELKRTKLDLLKDLGLLPFQLEHPNEFKLSVFEGLVEAGFIEDCFNGRPLDMDILYNKFLESVSSIVLSVNIGEIISAGYVYLNYLFLCNIRGLIDNVYYF
ncbi:MAG: hypothetical protein KatS3mg090_0737 [Patescibacteria group bacterium]|nr:MAG: hypothetical protein KatS3mg090_0737 [Patescibacteria group bacterium]